MSKRFIIYLAGIILLALGIVLSTKTNWGVSAVSSVPFVISEISPLSLGNMTMIMYFVYVALQILLLKRIFIKILLQIPLSIVFGYLVDFFDQLLAVDPSGFLAPLFFLTLSIVTTALGAYLLVAMDLVFNPADGMVNTLSVVSKKEFGIVKIIFDCSLVVLSMGISYLVTGQIMGFGVGTIASAIFVGRCISIFGNWLSPYLVPMVDKSRAKLSF